jgi:hypothetical protein
MRCYSVDSAKGLILPVFETVPACIPTTKTAHWFIFEPTTQQQNPCSSGHREGARCSGMAAAHLAKKGLLVCEQWILLQWNIQFRLCWKKTPKERRLGGNLTRCVL